MHEVLHSYLDDDDISYAVIELLTNKELIERLFNIHSTSIINDGYWWLAKIKADIYHNRIQFASDNNPQKNIYEFIDNCNKLLYSNKNKVKKRLSKKPLLLMV